MSTSSPHAIPFVVGPGEGKVVRAFGAELTFHLTGKTHRRTVYAGDDHRARRRPGPARRIITRTKTKASSSKRAA